MLLEDNADLVELPVIHQHPHFEFHDALLHSMPWPQFPDAILETLAKLDVPSLTFLTDGSCKNPTYNDTCFSAYAIVADLSTADEHRKHAAEGFLVLGKITNILQTVLVGRTQGKHCIHRAELSAIVLLFEIFENFSVYTDSATSIALINRCRSALSLEELCNHEDVDLLQRIYFAMSPTKQVHKIKAHQNLTSIRDPLKRFHALGNMVADLSAAKACDSLFPTVVDQLNEFFLDQKQQRERVFSYYKLRVDLQLARAKSHPTMTSLIILLGTLRRC